MNKQELFDKFIEFMGRFAEIRAVAALRDGFIMTTPFGLPIVFNPYLLVPFILVPLLALIITYASIAIGFMNPFSAVQVPWTTSPIIAGLLLNGWQGAVVQIIIIAMSTAVYFPFVRAQDKAMLAEEAGEPALHH